MFGLGQRRADPRCMGVASEKLRLKLDQAIAIGASIYCAEISAIDDSIRLFVESQMFMISISTSLFNGCLTDAYYDAGLADPLRGLPPLKADHDARRAALRAAWGGLSPITRANLDTRYRYIYVNRLMSPGESEVWREMEAWSENCARYHFQYNQQVLVGWVKFIKCIGQSNPEAALLALRDYNN